MPLPAKIFALLGVLLLLQSLLSLLDGFRFRSFVRRSFARPLGDHRPPVAVIIPCKGVAPDFEMNVTSFLMQDYPGYQVIFAVASRGDAAYALLSQQLRALESASAFPAGTSVGPRNASLVVAGLSDERGEKVNNMVRALAEVDAGTEVLAFADIDARPNPRWLRSLVAPLGDPSVMVSTGFRWYLPGRSFASQARAAWDTSIATTLGGRSQRLVWGGSMAMRAADFARLRIAERYWAHTVSDDYAVARAVRESGGRIRFEPRCLVESREESSFGDFLRWSNRQIILTRVYAARLWGLGLASYALYGATFLLGLIAIALPASTATERAAVAVTLVAILLLGVAKARLRTQVAREIFPEESATLHRYGARYWQLAPLVPWIMLFNFVVAGFTRRMEWAGVHYELRSADEVGVVGRRQ
ncbi:MAG TPA: glycosyltransferase [Terriglobia bacterium]|nr:glycosyltransferase [Terriglobia bacterium]